MEKRGDVKYDMVYYAIMGVLIVTLAMYMIFNELWSEDDINLEVCRESILARSVLPDVTLEGFANVVSFKDAYPLRCETRVVEVKAGELDNIKGLNVKIAKVMAECWGLYDSGDSSAFPAELFGSKTSCVPCARVHFTDEAVDKMRSEGIEFNIREALDEPMDGKGFSYYQWLKYSGKKFSAFDLAMSSDFVMEGKGVFSVKGGGGLMHSAEFYIDERTGLLRVKLPISIPGVSGIKIEDFTKEKFESLSAGTFDLLGVDEELFDIAQRMAKYLEDNVHEDFEVSGFCANAESLKKYCVVLREFVAKESYADFEGDANDWKIVVDYSDIRDVENGIVFKTKTGLTSEFDSVFVENVASVSFPEIYDPRLGDLLIGYGVATFNVDLDIGSYIPYLFYFQAGQDGVFDEVRKKLFSGTYEMTFCDEWEGVPV
jgi:hypothetical protein